jgi:catechol 2,3-dioxygenase-like lactoylglutathione lyase family enzyme
MGPVRELRVAITAESYEEALAYYRDALGLPVVESWENDGGSGAILDAGRATLEVLSRSQVDYVDGIEAGGTPSGPVRLALEVEDSVASAEVLEAAGAERLGGPS